ncbi:MAG: Ig-like domain-containing protein, partial [Planctomycetes bacterium]|nr:Ig-like domain-containing protein [Planctomycetota bacterium]
LSVTAYDVTSTWGALVEVDSDGSFIYRPGTVFDGLSLGESVVDTFTYTVSSDQGAVGTATVQVIMQGANDAPVAFDDVPEVTRPEMYVRANATTTLGPATLLSNDRDVDVNDALAILSADATSERGATLSIVNGQIVYDPTAVPALNALTAGERLTDRFAYTAVDLSGFTSTAMVSVIVQSPANVDPEPGADTIQIAEDGRFSGSLLANDGDSDALPGDPSLVAVAGVVTSGLGATVTILADGTFQYDATNVEAVQALNFTDTVTDTFPYQILDSQGGTATATATITISGANDPPDAQMDEFAAINGGTLLVIPANEGLLSNDSDVDSAAVIVDLLASDTVSAGGVPLTINPDGSFEYDPSVVLAYLTEGEVFNDSFRYTIIDAEGGMATGTVALQVIGVNDMPVAGIDGIERGFWTVATQPLVIPAENGVLINDFDPDAGETDQLRVVVSATSDLGATVTLNADGSITYDPTTSPTLQSYREAGIDVVDSFTYTLFDPHTDPGSPAPLALSDDAAPSGVAPAGAPASPAPAPAQDDNTPPNQGVVDIILRSGPSAYSFDLVASGFQSLGEGPSINNHGHVAFQGTNGNKDSIYIWDEDKGSFSLISEGMLAGFQPPHGALGDVPFASFSETVQLNDDDILVAQRQMNVQTVLGVMPMGLPLLTFAPVALSYVEHWNGSSLLDGSGIGLARQVAVGDSGIAAAGIRWGHPLFKDMEFLALFSLLPGAIGAAISAPFTLQPRIWTLNPAWSSVYYSPVDPLWGVGNDPDNFDFDTLSAIALATSLVPGFIGNLFATPVTLAYPAVSLANQKVDGASNPINNDSVYMTAFSALENSRGTGEISIVNYPHPGHLLLTASPTDEVVTSRHIADNGYSVYAQDDTLYSLDFSLNSTSISDFTSVGSKPSISDNGIIVFAADHQKLGR